MSRRWSVSRSVLSPSPSREVIRAAEFFRLPHVERTMCAAMGYLEQFAQRTFAEETKAGSPGRAQR